MIADVIGQLRTTERELAGQLQGVRAAIKALNAGNSGRDRRRIAATTPGRKHRRRLSAKARAAISRAQKLRWAKHRAAQK